jgi:crotonobetainyl-CoA:carnitine CoA-transferase CaiB-like acyl-CoA transferase
VKGPLAGIKVLDLSQVIAGPFGSAVLTHAGAEVIKIEALTGEISRGNLASAFLSWNRGKRGLAINLQTEAGREVFYRLAAEADVLMENFRAGVVERLKVDYETLSAINPRLIYVSVTAFGSTGPYAHRPGFDPLIQAMTGIERAQGGPHNPPVFMRIAITDYVTALQDAAAVTIALYNRERTGKGVHIRTSLLRAGMFINAEVFTKFADRPPRALPDAGQNGLGPLDRMYEASDGRIFILVEDDQDRWNKLVSLPRLSHLSHDARFVDAKSRQEHADELAGALESIFKSDSAGAWLRQLEAAGVPCAPVVDKYDQDFFHDVQPVINRYVVVGQHAERGHVEHPGNFIHYSADPTSQEGLSAPLLGEHTGEILREVGYSDDDMVRLRSEGVIL